MSDERKETIVNFRSDDEFRQVLKVVESTDFHGDDQVQIVLRAGTKDEHISIHQNRAPEGRPKLTHYAPEIADNVWDSTRIEVAKSLEYKNPERHGNYVLHTELPPYIEGANGIFLSGRLLNMLDAPNRAKYHKLPSIEIEIESTSCMIEFYLSTPKQPYEPATDPHISTKFGDLYFRAKPAG